MMAADTYHPGGFLPGKPGQNLAERITAAGRTTWDAAGALTSTRPLTADESADLAEQETQAAAEANAEALSASLRAALPANNAFLAKPSPIILTDLEAQVRRLTRESSALIRTVTRLLDDITGT